VNYLLDTCVISELVKKDPDQRVVEWISSVPEERLYLSVLTLGEIKKGICKLPESIKKKKLLQWLEEDVRFRFDGRLIPLDEAILLEWGRTTGEAEGKGRSLPVIDSLFAATAIHHRLTLVTRNEADMGDLGVTVMNPWVGS